MNVEAALQEYSGTIDQITHTLHKKNNDVPLNSIRGMAESALWELMCQNIDPDKIPGAIFNKTNEAVKQEKGIKQNNPLVRVDREIIENQDLSIKSEVSDKFISVVEEIGDITDKEKFIIAAYYKLSIHPDYFRDIKWKEISQLLFDERFGRSEIKTDDDLGFGIIRWSISHIARKIGCTAQNVSTARNSALKKFKKHIEQYGT